MINVQVSDVRSDIKETAVLVHNDDFSKNEVIPFTKFNFCGKIYKWR